MKGKIKYLMIIVAIIVSMAIMIPSANGNLSLFANNNSMSADISGEKTPDIHNVDSQSLFSTTDSGLSSSGVVAQNLVSGDSHNHASLLAGDTRAATSGGHGNLIDHPTTGNNGTWQEINQATLPAGGTINSGWNCYLSSDVTIQSTRENFTIPAGTATSPVVVNLCLNGHKLTGNGSGSVITVGANATLNLYDCNGSGKSHSYKESTETATKGLYVFDAPNNPTSSTKVTGGVITGGSAPISVTNEKTTTGGGINNSGTLNLYGGTIAGNKATEPRVIGGGSGNGGGVYVNTNGTFTMSGGTISGNKSTKGGGVYSSGTFTMNSGTISGNNANSHGGGVYVESGKFTIEKSNNTAAPQISSNIATSRGGGIYVDNMTFTMSGITISNNTASSGGGVYFTGVTDKTFNMTDGTISGNTATGSFGGGGVHVDAYADFNMTDGTISGNTASTGGGGGVYFTGGSLTMSGTATISSNTAGSGSGGGVYSDGDALTMSDTATISGNIASSGSGGGVYVASGNTFTMSGSPIVTGNVKDGTITGGVLSGGTANNVYLYSSASSGGRKITVAGTLTTTVDTTTTNAKIGVTLADTYKGAFTSGYTTTAEGVATNNGTNPSKYFFMDNEKAVVLDSSGEVAVAPPHTHTDGNASIVFDNDISATGGSLVAGKNYVLNGDVTLTNNLTIPANATVNLCLNGFKLTGNGSGSVITVASGGTLNLHDCQADSSLDKHKHDYYIDSTGKFVYDLTTAPADATHGTTYAGVITGGSASGGGINNSGTLNMTGGTIAGNKTTANGNGGGVYSSGTFNMTGGNIFGNTAISGVGGGVYVHAGKFNISASDNKVPIISQNKASSSGGGVYVNLNSTFTMSGGTISENSTTHGAGIYYNGSIFKMTGGTISGNIASGNGGGVALAGGTSTISNTAQISGNKAASGGGIRIDGSAFTMSGGTISGNTAQADGGLGGGVSVSYYPNNSSLPGSFTMSGGTISGNKATTSGLGGGVHVNTNCTFTMSGGTIGGTGTSDANTATNGSGVYSNGTTFEMKNGTNNEIPNISGNTATADGGGVIVFSGTFTMSGGAISNNTATADAGGVLTHAGTTFTMSGGTITGNKATTYSGGGVYNVGTFTMSGGSISNNDATTNGGGVYSSGTFTMSGSAKISDNDATTNGGGVYSSSTFTMSGGTIGGTETTDANTATNGGGVYVHAGTFNMSASDNKVPIISQNTATNSGGGVYIAANCTFTMSGGTIGGTEATAANSAGVYGGGVYVNAGGTFEMTNGKISYNKATLSGGGVTLFGTGAAFTMSGGEITSNSATSNEQAPNEGGGVFVYEGTFTMSDGTISSNKAKSGGGVYIHSHNTPQFKISGTPKITDNTLIDDATNNNVHLSTGKVITVTGPLTAGASIGIPPYPARIFTSGYGTNNTTSGIVTPPTFFTLDDDSNGTIGIKLNTTNGVTEAEIAAKYTLTFDVNGGTDAAAGAPTSSILFNGDALTAIDKAKLPTRADYIFMGYFDAKNNGTKYFNADGTVSTEGGTPKIFDKEANTIFYAQWKKDISTITDFVVKVKADGKAPIYKGSAFTADDLSVTSTTAGTNFTFEMETDGTVLGNGTTVDNTNASISGQTTGNKTARIKIIGTGEYTGTTYFNFAIGKATLTITPNADQTKVYGAADPALTYAHSGAENNETPSFVGALSRATGDDVGTYEITIGTLALTDGTSSNAFKASNYTLKFSETVVNFTFTITKKPLAADMIDDFVVATYNGEEQEPTMTVTDSAATITANDYDVSYMRGSEATIDFTNAGPITVVVAGKRNYSGTISKEYVISPKELTVTWTGENNNASDFEWIYNNSQIKPTATAVTGIAADGTLTLTVSGEQTNASETAYTATASMSTPNTNYTLTETTKEFTIKKARITLSDLAASGITYGDPLSTSTLTGTAKYTSATGEADVAGVFAWYDGSVKPTVTNNGIQVNFTPTDRDNFNSVSTHVSLVVTPKALTAAAFTDSEFADKTYNGIEQKFLPTIKDGEVLLTAGTDYTVTYKRGEAESTDVTNVGTITVVVTGKGNYSGTISREYEIVPKTLTITPNADQTKVYGAADPALTYAHSGAENNETPSFVGALSRATGDDVGTYAITKDDLALADGTDFKASNYTLKFSETVVNFTITKKPLAADMIDDFVVATYNGEEQEPTVTVTDSPATITAADYTLAWEYKDAVGGAYSSVIAPEFKNAGTYKVTITATADGNYSDSASKEYVIGQKAATIAGTSETIIKVVNGVASASPDLIEAKHYTLTGVNGESLSVKITKVEFASAGVGTDIVVTVTAELDNTNADNTNYTFGTPTTTFTIKGEIVNSNAVEGTETTGDYFVTSSDSAFFTNATGKNFTKGDLTIRISTGSKYKAIGFDASGTETSLTINQNAKNISVFMQRDDNSEWEYVFINYAVDKANPTIGDMTITNEVGEELTNWFNNDSVKVIIDGVSDENSQVSWTDDVNAMTLEKIETSGESTTQTPIDFEKDATTGKISFALNYTDTATINGVYRLTVYDNVGNESYKDFTINKHDNVAPTIADNTTADTWLGATTVAYTIQDGESAHPSAVLSTVVKVNGKTISGFAGSLTFNASGIYSVEITATDNAGNTSTYKESIHIDTLIDELKTLYGEFDAAGADAAKDAAAIAFENKWKSLTDTQKSHVSFVDSPAEGVINGNKEISDCVITIKEHIEDRKDAVNTAEADAIISGLAGTLTEDDLRDLIANYERADDDVKKLIDEDRSTTPTAKENIENSKIVLPLMNILKAKPNNNDQLNAWVETWKGLSPEQQTLAIKLDNTLTARAGHYETYKTEIDELISGVNAVTKLTAENKATVGGLIAKYDTMKDNKASLETSPVVTQQDLVPLNVLAKLEGWDKINKKTEAVEDLIAAITADITTDNFETGYSEYLKAKEAFDALSKDEQGLVSNSADLTTKGDAYYRYISGLEESEKKAAEDRKKANEVIRAIEKLSYGTVTPYVAGSTVHDIIATQKMYDELTDEQKAIVDANAAKAKLDEFTRVRKEVFANGEETPAEIINDIIAIDLTSATRDELDALINDYDNTSDNGKLLIKNTIPEKLDELTDLIARLKKAEEEIGKIPTGSQNEHECSLCNSGTSGDTAHDTVGHIESIEDAKIAFEKLTESEKGLLTPGLKTRIETEYEKLKTLLEAQTQKLIVYDKAENVDVSVIGLNSKVNTSKVPNIATAAEVTIYVDAKKTNNVLTDLPDTMKNVASFDVKLMAKAGDDKATEIQPTLGKKVLVKLPVGANIDRGAAKVYHIKANGSRAIVEKVSFISEGNNMYAVFEIDSFSEFIVVDEKKATPPSGGGGGSSISKVDLFWANVRNEIELKDTNPVVVDLREEKLNSVPKHILEAQKESDKALTLKFAEGDIAITNKMAKGTEYLKDSYTYADLSAMFERAPIEPTPTPTPTPTPEPTEENTVWQLSLAIVLILLATICVIAVITRKRRKR